jgi:hypothetical protein
MSKKIKFFFLSLINACLFLIFVSLPYDWRYIGLILFSLGMMFSFWYGFGKIRLAYVVLPISLFLGYALFTTLLPFTVILVILMSIIYGIICYFIFLLQNVFIVAIEYKTVPLYRAAHTVGSIISLFSAFFLFNTIFSFRWLFIWNALAVFLVSCFLFYYTFWSVNIENYNENKSKKWFHYVLTPAFLMSQLAIIFSFWPVGIFKGSIYLVSIMYIIQGLLQSDLRGRFFKRIWLSFFWIGIAIILGIILTTEWR